MQTRFSLHRYLLILLFLSFISGGLYAQSTIEVSIDHVEECPAGEVIIPVRTSTGFSNVLALQFRIPIDPEKLEGVSTIGIHPSFMSGSLSSEYNPNLQLLSFSWMGFGSTLSIPADAILFEINGNYNGGEQILEFTGNSTFYGPPLQNPTPLPSQFIAGSLSPLLDIVEHPESVTADIGADIAFSVAAVPAGPPTVYQWQKDTGDGWVDIADGINYTGSGNSQLLKTNVSASDHGSFYRVLVSMDECALISDPAALSVTDQPDLFRLRMNSLPENAGDPSGEGFYEEGEEVIIQSNPNTGYHFLEWREEQLFFSGEDPHTLVMPGRNLTLTAHYELNVYTISVSVEPEGAGSVEGDDVYAHGETVLLTATPAGGYVFDHWSDDGNLVHEDPEYTFQATSDRNLVAHFSPDVFTINAQPNNEEFGTVEGAGEYEAGSEATLNALPETGYHFMYWKEDDNIVSTEPVYVFTVTSDRNLVAHFALEVYTIEALVNDPDFGYTEGSGNYGFGDEVTLTAFPFEGHHFIKWTEEGEEVSSEIIYVFTATANRSLMAHFAVNEYTITASSGPNGGITPSGDIILEHGDSVSFVFLPDTGYQVDHVTVDGEEVSVSDSFTFTNVQQDHQIHVEFALKSYIIDAASTAGGSIEPEGEVEVLHGSNQTFTFEADEGFHLTDVVVDGQNLGVQNSFTFVNVTNDHSIQAVYQINTYTLLYGAGPNGILLGEPEQTVEHGGNGSLVEAQADEGYHFSHWSDGHAEASRTDENVTSDLDVTAFFSVNTYIISATAGEGGSISPDGDVEVNHGDDLGFVITPDEGYEVADLQINGSSVGPLDTFTFEQVTDNQSIHASFALKSYTISASAGSNGSISPQGEISVDYDEDQVFAIIPDAGYHVSGLIVDGQHIEPSTEFTFFNVVQDHSIHAEFTLNTYIISATAEEGGSVSPEGETEVSHGSDQIFVINADEGFHVLDILVDGESVGASSSYTFLNVTSDHSIHAIFAINTYTLIYSADENGSVQGDTEQSVAHGGQGSPVEAVPDEGYHFMEWSDGLTDNPRQDSNVTADINVMAHFELSTFSLIFHVEDQEGNAIPDAVVSLNGTTYEAGHYVFGELVPGSYDYVVSRDGYFDEDGQITVVNQDINVAVVMTVDDTWVSEPKALGLTIYPNPAGNWLTIATDEAFDHVRIMDVLGQVAYEHRVFGNYHQMNVEGLKPGIYIIQVNTPGRTETKRVKISR